ncbi:MAG: type I restriction enzyme HsdR N-terminal domain-containing protein [Bacteroidales bacterium]|nr:type I restriction enzyme HsdR N-terminal domain-containing protein [Bacteroidales bacterium]
MYPSLHFPTYNFTIRTTEIGDEIFDIVRKKYVSLTPEEWVRQHLIRFLIQERAVPMGRIKIEKILKIQTLNRRADVVVYDDYAKPLLIVECKAPQVKINQNVFNQISCYNKALNVNHLIVTNGIDHYYCTINHETRQIQFESDIPMYQELKKL